MRNLGASQKNIPEIYNESVQHFFRKVRRWQSEEKKNNLFQKIKEEDIRSQGLKEINPI